jgi:hypothetical protein
MAKQLINTGSSQNKGDGDPLRTAFTKINENFSELYTDVEGLLSRVESSGNTIERDIIGNVIAQDSTLLVDAVNANIPKANVQDSTNWDTAHSWGDHSTAGYLTSYTETDPVVGAVNGIIKADGAGNISAAVAGTDYLQSETIDLATLKTEVAASVDFADFQTRIAAL